MENIYEIDTPIYKIEDDELNRTKFVEILANSIINYDSNECLVIGLIGEWGCGKSSIINMVYNRIETFNGTKINEEKWIKIKFNPWYFSNRNTMIIRFFQLLMEECKTQDMELKIFEYLSQLKDELYKKISISSGNETDNYQYDDFNNIEIYNSFNSIKNNLMKLFSEVNYKIIISIDDIDRLTDEEMQEVFLLVKALADFPNIIYILSFDKNVALKALTNLQVYSPEKFLEKIIQIPIKIPEITKTRLEILIENKLKPIYESNLKSSENNFTQILNYIKPFFANIRDLKRYTNVLNFYLNQFKEEINIGDFLLIIAIQLFEEELYEKIKDNKDLLTNYTLFKNINEKSNIYNDFLKGITNLKKYDSTKINELMGYLFPILKNYDSEFENYYKNMYGTNLNIASNLHFDKYFTLSIEENEVSQIIIDKILESRDINEISQIMLHLIKDNKELSLFNKLESNTYRIEMEDAGYFIEPLFLIGDNAKYMSKLCNLIDSLFNLQFDGNKSYNILKKMLINSDSFFIACYFLDKLGDKYGLYYGTESKSKDLPYIEPDEFKELKNIAYNKLNNCAYNGNLFDNPHFKYFLDLWKAWGTKDEVILYVESNLNESNVIEFIEKFKIDSEIIFLDENEKFEAEDKFDFQRLFDYVHPDEICGLVKGAISQENISEDKYKLGKLFIKECNIEAA